MGKIVAVPNHIMDKINEKLDETLPDEATDEDREALKGQLLAYVDEYGFVPDFTVEKRSD